MRGCVGARKKYPRRLKARPGGCVESVPDCSPRTLGADGKDESQHQLPLLLAWYDGSHVKDSDSSIVVYRSIEVFVGQPGGVMSGCTS